MESLKGKVVIVTGAGSGIGEAIARVFASYGSKIVIADMNGESLDRVCSAIGCNGGQTLGVVTNVAVQADLENLVGKAIEKFGTVDVLVNNAGIMDNFMTLGDLDPCVWQRVMDVNVKGPTMLSQIVVNHWLENNKPGVIVNTASVGGMFGARGGVSYVTSKHAVIGMTKNIASVYRDNGIRCVAVAPGGVKTNIGNTLKNPDKKGMEALSQYVAAGPEGDPMDIANVVAFLASDKAGFVNGTVVTVDGGWTGA